MSSLFYLANLIGYFRVLALLIATFYSEDTIKFLIFYFISYALDAVDGPVARAFNGTSKLGSVLDMVTDRASTAVLLALLKDPPWLFALVLDISSHWFHTSASLMKGEKTHKQAQDKILQWYYERENLFVVCFLNEAFLCSYFLISRGYNFPIEIVMTLCPAFLLKQAISVLHLVRAIQSLSVT